MKVKRILKFYFAAESLERAFDNLILKYACAAGERGLVTAERICALIGEKNELAVLWGYLDGVMADFSAEEREAVRKYAFGRGGGAYRTKEYRRLLMKFTRRARRIGSFGGALLLVGKYYCLLAPV